MRRVLVAGISGSGKSTLARRLAAALDLRYVELDALHHGPGWVPRPEFVGDVRAFAAGPAWVTEWQYAQVRDLLLGRADTVLWLDYPRWVVMGRVLRRSVLRAALRQKLFNGNVERWRDWLQPDHPVRWAWSQHRRKRADFERVLGEADGVTVVRFRRPRQTARWIRTLR